MNDQPVQKRVIIVGGGFGGLRAARSLRRANVDVTLIDRRNFHLFQPLLYQVATGGLSPANIASPIRSILRHQKNVNVLLGTVGPVNPVGKTIEVESVEPGESQIQRRTLKYDWLIVAAGATHSYFGHDDWEAIAPGLKTIEDATEIRGRVFAAFEAAEHEQDAQRRAELMTFVIVGGGPTGVELAGAIAELARMTLRLDFRNINPPDARIILVDGQDRMLATFPPELSQKAHASLQRLGVEIQTGMMVTAIHKDRVELVSEGRPKPNRTSIASRTVLWAAGVAAVPLGKTIAAAAGIETDRAGRVPVQQDLSVAGFPDLFVIGDLASFTHQTGKPLPGVAPVAMQQGKYVGRLITQKLQGKSSPKPFVYRDQGSMATIGRSAAVADLGWMKCSGLVAWLLWIFVHIMSIAQYQNRVLVFMQWAWNYVTFNRSARLITESHHSKRHVGVGTIPTKTNRG